MTAITLSTPRTLVRHTIVIWTTPDDATTDLEHLAREAVSGGGYCSNHEQLTVHDPMSDEHPPSQDFFHLYPDRTVYAVYSRPAAGTGGVGAMEWRETEAEARDIYAQFVRDLNDDPDGGSVMLCRYETSLQGNDLTDELNDDTLADDPTLQMETYARTPLNAAREHQENQ